MQDASEGGGLSPIKQKDQVLRSIDRNRFWLVQGELCQLRRSIDKLKLDESRLSSRIEAPSAANGACSMGPKFADAYLIRTCHVMFCDP